MGSTVRGHVFISAAGEDRAAAEQACGRLESVGFRCWMAPRDIVPGRKWSESIVDAIDAAGVMLVILSQQTHQSDQVEREIERATNRRIPIVPFRIQDVPLSKSLQYFLTTAHWLDAFTRPLEEHLDALVSTVQSLTAEPPQARQEVAQRHPLAAGVQGRGADGHLAAVGRKVVLLSKRGAAPDDAVIEVVRAGLTQAGHDVFIDRHMQIGVEWAREIERQITAADAVVVVLSAASVQSEMVAYEVHLARSAAARGGGKPRLLPVRFASAGDLPQDLDASLGGLQFFLWSAHDDDERLARELAEAVSGEPRVEAAPVATARRPTLEAVGGAVPLNSRFYVVRSTDGEFAEAIARHDSVILIKGARQMGKTSLLGRGLAQARQAGARVGFTDFQKFEGEQLRCLRTFYAALGSALAARVGVDDEPIRQWSERQSANVNFERFVRDVVLEAAETPLVWGMDEVDRLFTCGFGGEAFALFRTWHNERVMEPDGPWGRLTMAIAYATEANLFITDVNQSPFNVGTRLELDDFTLAQVAELHGRHGASLPPEGIKRLYELIGGQPFLVRRALYESTTRSLDAQALELVLDRDDGPFGDHLRRMLVMLARDERLCNVMRGVLRGEGCPDAESFYRLRSAGIVVGDSARDATPRCAVYQSYLRRHLL